jgi:nitrate reductase delta subunit
MKQQVYAIISDWLDYPSEKVKLESRENRELLTENNPAISNLINEFVNFYENNSLDKLEEIYTSTFDLNPTCYPYVGYQLFGDGYQRGEFLVKLKEKYQQFNFKNNSQELADHLTIILDFLGSLSENNVLKKELIEDGLIPSLEKMKEGFKETNPYAQLLDALLLILNSQVTQSSCLS